MTIGDRIRNDESSDGRAAKRSRASTIRAAWRVRKLEDALCDPYGDETVGRWIEGGAEAVRRRLLDSGLAAGDQVELTIIGDEAAAPLTCDLEGLAAWDPAAEPLPKAVSPLPRPIPRLRTRQRLLTAMRGAIDEAVKSDLIPPQVADVIFARITEALERHAGART